MNCQRSPQCDQLPRLVCWLVVVTAICVSGDIAPADEPAFYEPLKAREDDATMRRWLDKQVANSRRLDDMESLDAWKISVWNQGQGTVELTADRCRDGRHSMRFRTSTTGTRPSPDGGVFGATSAVRSFAGEDWRDFNRLSFWVYPHLPGF